MILTSRTPLRVSLFGGGSDYPSWYRREPGAVLGFTIDKYIYISALRLTSFVDYRFRVSYSRVELEREIGGIAHPAVRTILDTQGFDVPTDFSVQADMPANAGLGSSSAFAVGFLNLVSALRGVRRTRLELAELAIDLEQNVLAERVGIQDQLHAAFGGLNRFDFHGERLSLRPVRVGGAELDRLSDWMLLVYTGLKRHASVTVQEQIDNTTERRVDERITAMVELVDEAQAVLEGTEGERLPIELAALLDRSWQLKRGLSSQISNPQIDALYEDCRRNGALAGKLCGAGAGGFLLVVVAPEDRARLVEAVGADRCIPFAIEHSGSLVRQQW